MPVLESTMVPLDTPAPPFNLLGTDGLRHDLADYADSEVLVVVFTCNHCPYAQAAEDRLIDLQRDYGGIGVQMVAINPNDAQRYPDDDFQAMQRRAREKQFPFPYLWDETQEVAKAYRAVCTPDIFVYGPERTLQYRGRIDDNWKQPDKAVSHELRAALDALLVGADPAQPQRPSMGCSIKWKDEPADL